MICKHLVEKQSTHSNSTSKKLDDILGQNISHDEVFKKKLIDIKEIKLKEFKCYLISYLATIILKVEAKRQ